MRGPSCLSARRTVTRLDFKCAVYATAVHDPVRYFSWSIKGGGKPCLDFPSSDRRAIKVLSPHLLDLRLRGPFELLSVTSMA